MASYEELTTVIIKKLITVIGTSLALKAAHNVNDLEVNDDGEVLKGASKESLSQLMDEYKKIGGGVASWLARKVIAPLLQGNEDLPDDLKWNFPKEDKK